MEVAHKRQTEGDVLKYVVKSLQVRQVPSVRHVPHCEGHDMHWPPLI